MPNVIVGDISMYCEVHGKGEPLVYLNGAGVSVRQSQDLIPAYASDFKLVLYDPRGIGRTDAPDYPYTMEMMADDLAGLLDAIGIGEAHICGISFGGGIALYFALRHPGKVKSLVLLSTSCRAPVPVPEALEIISKLGGLSARERAVAVQGLYVTPAWAEQHSDVIDALADRSLETENGGAGVLRQLQARGEPIDLRLNEITAPTLIIHGDADISIPPDNARFLASGIPDAELVILKDTGHSLLESQTELHRTMIDFLHRVDGAEK